MPKQSNSSNSLGDVLKNLSSKYGKESILPVKEKDKLDIESISTNCYSLDRIFGCGGLPRGRIIEIYGPESSGKSTLAMYLMAQVQKEGGRALLVDAEFAFSKDYANKIGVDTNDLILSQPSSGEEGLDIVDKMIKTGDIDVIVVDSVAALVPLAELAGEISDTTIALQARMMSKSLRMITATVAKTKTCVIFINQIRERIGMYIGKKTTTTGGRALNFYASVRLEVRSIGKIKDKNDEVIGNHLKIIAMKNKVGLPFRQAEVDLYFEKGLDVIGDIVDIAIVRKIIGKEGNTYYFGKEKIGVGRDATRNCIEQKPEIFGKIKKELLK